MASSNRHWPSMFKSKPCNPHHQWQHDINPPAHISSCPRAAPYASEYGQVGDANVFYWFQNRKSRSKHKQRHLHTSKSHTHHSSPVSATTFIAPSSSSSSSEKSPPKRTNKLLPIGGLSSLDASNSPTASVNQTYFQSHGDVLADPFFYPMQQTSNNNLISHGLCFPELSNIVQIPHEQVIGPCTAGILLSELLSTHGASKREQEEEKLNLEQQLRVGAMSAPAAVAKSTVYINNVAFEVAIEPFNVREAFGNDVVLIHSSGQPVLTNEWGVTLQSLQPGAVYYLVCTSNIFI
ncbi:hypothetical protein IFM89_007855 [Coptis chinensis]|uniref:Homeobox domain-containing protein n=1 Tax=Coptis chinensis TaxID=261450 RepID=A0A835GV82_9MAGN|nr:hypothetical protein IFM89_007855 [Coptis chinensis]